MADEVQPKEVKKVKEPKAPGPTVRIREEIRRRLKENPGTVLSIEQLREIAVEQDGAEATSRTQYYVVRGQLEAEGMTFPKKEVKKKKVKEEKVETQEAGPTEM